MALAAFETLMGHFPALDVRMILVGEGPEERSLRVQAERIEPSGRVIFLPFHKNPEELLSAFDVFVMPSVNEGLPLALAEAMACECCPIATDVGGIAEAVSRPDLGWLVPVGNIGRFADAMIDAASRTADERTAMGRRAREQAVQRFNAAIQYDAIARVIESLGPAGRIEQSRHLPLRERARL